MKRVTCKTCHGPLTSRYQSEYCSAACYRASPATPRACVVCGCTFLANTPRRICSKRCEMQAYRARVAARGEPSRHCRICGCRGISVPLVEIPSDAGGGHLCKLCLVEGLKRAA